MIEFYTSYTAYIHNWLNFFKRNKIVYFLILLLYVFSNSFIISYFICLISAVFLGKLHFYWTLLFFGSLQIFWIKMRNAESYPKEVIKTIWAIQSLFNWKGLLLNIFAYCIVSFISGLCFYKMIQDWNTNATQISILVGYFISIILIYCIPSKTLKNQTLRFYASLIIDIVLFVLIWSKDPKLIYFIVLITKSLISQLSIIREWNTLYLEEKGQENEYKLNEILSKHDVQNFINKLNDFSCKWNLINKTKKVYIFLIGLALLTCYAVLIFLNDQLSIGDRINSIIPSFSNLSNSKQQIITIIILGLILLIIAMNFFFYKKSKKTSTYILFIARFLFFSSLALFTASEFFSLPILSRVGIVFGVIALVLVMILMLLSEISFIVKHRQNKS